MSWMVFFPMAGVILGMQPYEYGWTHPSPYRRLSQLAYHSNPDESGDEYEENEDDSFMSLEMDPCMMTNELRIFVATWNVAGRSPVGSLAFDLAIILSFGGEDMKEATNWNLLIGQILNDKCACRWTSPMTDPITSDQDYNYLNNATGGTSTTIVEEDANSHCGRVKVSAVACGIMGYLGNKGSVSVSMSIEGTSFCFIVAHLASGEKKGDEGRRNHQVSEIFKRTTFTRHFRDSCIPQPLTILGHELFLENDLARELIKKHDWTALQEFDQLRQELGDGGVFQGWKEGNIEFAPTYKYSKFNSNRYSGTHPNRAGEKQRTPAWCDRILWYGKEVKQHSYFRSESKFSDHRPVSALFSTQIEVIKSNDAKVVPLQEDVPNTVSFVHIEQEKDNGEASSTLKSLIAKEMARRFNQIISLDEETPWL
ncbi:type I inositol polyphosphate 5-phosphatase 4-like protein [Tanacetum coccineum]